MKNILITGSTGLLGKILIKKLKKLGKSVIAVTNNSKFLKEHGILYKKIDFSKYWSIKDLPQNIDVIIHLAQSLKFRDFPENTLDVFRVNVESTLFLLDYAKKNGIKKFIYASSGGIYDYGKCAFREDSPILPLNQS